MKTVTSTQNEKHFIVFFNNYEGYDSLEQIADLLVTEINAIVKEKIDGPDSRIWSLIIKQQDILLINNDPYGNFLRAESNEGKAVLKELLPKLEQIFR